MFKQEYIFKIYTRIDNDTEIASNNVDKGKKHIIEAYRHASSTRGLIFKVSFILINILTYNLLLK